MASHTDRGKLGAAGGKKGADYGARGGVFGKKGGHVKEQKNVTIVPTHLYFWCLSSSCLRESNFIKD
jgi:hypothetical protein